jgi:histidine ammonia-lyase
MIRLTGNHLDLETVARIARDAIPVGLDDDARTRMEASRAWVARAAAGGVTAPDGTPLPVYGVNTGYGSLARVRIPADRIRALSLNLVRSHAAGVGPMLPKDAVRGMMLLRANALAKGASGCRPALVDVLCEMLNRDVTPEIPSQGSCGSSGDLAPLSHLGLVLFRGEGDDPESSGTATFAGERTTGAHAMALAGLERLEPEPKEGLAITNGAQLSTALLVLACVDAAELVIAAEIAAAMTFEALRGVSRALHPAVMLLRPYRGAIACAANLRRLIDGSSLVDSLPDKVQDAYSLRCTPQILGACRDGVRFAREQARVEINAATDNPLILLDEGDENANKAFSAGLFHGEPVGMAADHLKLAVSELANLAERRVFRLTTGTLSSRLPPLLAQADRPGMSLMIPQSTAAALVSENKSLLWPASGDSIPTCEDQEDHVAMSTTASRRAVEVVGNSVRVVAIELLAAAHALWWRQSEGPVTLGTGTAAALAAVEDAIGPGGGEVAADDIERLARAILDGRLRTSVEARTGALAGADA